MIRFATLGAIDLRDNGAAELSAVLRQPKRLALLAYLAVATPRGFHRRDTLVGLLWPQLDDEHARSALRQAVRFLRRHLGADAIVSRGEEDLGLGERLWCDAVAFEQAVGANRTEAALELYRGDLLAGFFVSEAAPEFDQWIETERARLRTLAAKAAWVMAEQEERQGSAHGTTHWARRAMALSPQDESALRRLITLLDRIGDRAGAVRAYEDFAGHLSQEYQAEPTAETQALCEEVRRSARAEQRGGRTVRGVPEHREQAISKAFANSPADRFATAERSREALTPSGSTASTGAAPVDLSWHRGGDPGAPVRVAALFAAASVGMLTVVYWLMRTWGLPDWVLEMAVALLVAGLPIMVVTALIERRRAMAHSIGRVEVRTAGASQRWLTWRQAVLGGGAAFAALALGTAVYMAMRLLGIGPAGTLVASGVLKQREPLLLARFENHTPDSTLALALAEAFRVDLSQSPTVKLLHPLAVADALQRMRRPAGMPLDLALARELAQREGVKAIVTGEIDPVGKGYQLSASLVAARDGRVLTAVRETATDDRALIGAIDQLSRKLRERIGESLRTIRAGEPLAQVTTGSLEALRKYSEGARAEAAADWDRAAALYQEATTLDAGFAMAYRRLAAMLGNSGGPGDRIVAATMKAFELRDRLPEVERYLAMAVYYQNVDYDPTKAVAAYRSVLERDPDNWIALNNLALQLLYMRHFREAESLAVRATTLEKRPQSYGNAMRAEAGQGHYADAAATLERFARVALRSPAVLWTRALLASAQGAYPAAEQAALELREEQQANPTWHAEALEILVDVEAVQGKLARAERDAEEFMAVSERHGLPGDYLAGGRGISGALGIAEIDLRFRNRPAEGLRSIDTVLRRHPLASIPPLDRTKPAVALARYYARAGRLEEAKRLLAEYQKTTPEGIRKGQPYRHGAEGDILFAERRIADAIASYRQWHDEEWCASCGFFELAAAYEQARQPDSAVVFYERVVTTPGLQRIFDDAFTLAPALKRLGELYEERGNRAKALAYYGRFVELWKNTDPELQPVVRDVRVRLARLARER